MIYFFGERIYEEHFLKDKAKSFIDRQKKTSRQFLNLGCLLRFARCKLIGQTRGA
jgi:hypothetical protein